MSGLKSYMLGGYHQAQGNLSMSYLFFLKRYARVILNKVKELSCYESKIILRTTKVPHLLKGRFRDDIGF
jgi:hypothetical protein